MPLWTGLSRGPRRTLTSSASALTHRANNANPPGSPATADCSHPDHGDPASPSASHSGHSTPTAAGAGAAAAPISPWHTFHSSSFPDGDALKDRDGVKDRTSPGRGGAAAHGRQRHHGSHSSHHGLSRLHAKHGGRHTAARSRRAAGGWCSGSGRLLCGLLVLAAVWWLLGPLELLSLSGAGVLMAQQPPKTLVIYSLLEADLTNGENLVYFINQGAKPHPGCTFMILLHSELRHQVNLPELPAGATYEFHDSACLPWGAYAWVLRTALGIDKYSFFVFVDSSARGPFVAPYTKAGMHWTEHLTSRLSHQVKLVGASISCETLETWDATAHPAKLDTPHVQRHLFATDQEGMLLLFQAQPPVFACQKETDHPQLPEKSMSKVILEHGFTLDCLMLRYQGVDWRDERNWGCNARLDPSVELQYDGTNLSPIEVMFAPAAAFQSSVGTHTFHRMAKYTEWKIEQASNLPLNISSNAWKTNPLPSKAVDVCVMERRGSRCFDTIYYKAMNPELASLSFIQLWKHFVQFGQFEGRPHRFACEMDWESLFNQVASEFTPPPAGLLSQPPPDASSRQGSAGQAKPATQRAAGSQTTFGAASSKG